jgi:hypothetical protein
MECWLQGGWWLNNGSVCQEEACKKGNPASKQHWSLIMARNDMKIEAETASDTRKEFNNAQSVKKAKNDMANKVPSLADQMMQVERQY